MWFCLRIYICPVFPLVVVHSLPLSLLQSVHSKYLYFSGESCIIQAISFLQFSLCPFKYLASPFLTLLDLFNVFPPG